jgi:hypothetical protein
MDPDQTVHTVSTLEESSAVDAAGRGRLVSGAGPHRQCSADQAELLPVVCQNSIPLPRR